MTNREILLKLLSSDLVDILELNETEPCIDKNSFVGGFQILATHLDILIKNMEEQGSSAEAIIREIQNQLDNGPEELTIN